MVQQGLRLSPLCWWDVGSQACSLELEGAYALLLVLLGAHALSGS